MICTWEVASLSKNLVINIHGTDLEYENWDGITIWIGLKNLNKKTELSLLPILTQLIRFPKIIRKEH